LVIKLSSWCIRPKHDLQLQSFIAMVPEQIAVQSIVLLQCRPLKK